MSTSTHTPQQRSPQPPPAAVTVVIPFRNRANMVLRTLRSVLEQSVRPVEVIVVDNGSDATDAAAVREFINAESPAWTLLHEATRGAGAARNTGLREVRTPWVMFFDSDDIMHSDHIKTALETAQAHPRADIVGWNVVYVHNDGKRILRKFYDRDMAYHNLFHGSMSTQRYMVRTDLINHAGGWQNLPIWNDIELGARLLELHPHVAKRHGCPLVEVSVGADSISGLSFSSRGDAYCASLEAMRGTLGPERKSWTDLKEIILAGCFTREGDSRGRVRYKRVLDTVSGTMARLKLRFAYTYTARGGRGVARLLRRLI